MGGVLSDVCKKHMHGEAALGITGTRLPEKRGSRPFEKPYTRGSRTCAGCWPTCAQGLTAFK